MKPDRFRPKLADIAFLAVATLIPITSTPTSFAAADDVHFVIQFQGAAHTWSTLVVSTREGGHVQRAVTHFLPNQLTSAMRYHPARFEGEIVGVALEGIHVTDEHVVKTETGGFRPANDHDPPSARLELTRTFALDSRGRVTFFHGLTRAPGFGDVHGHIVWGYPPATELAGPAQPSGKDGGKTK